MPAIALNSMEAKAREMQREAERLAAEKANQPIQAVTGFLVYIMPDGSINMSADLNIPLTVAGRRTPMRSAPRAPSSPWTWPTRRPRCSSCRTRCPTS